MAKMSGGSRKSWPPRERYLSCQDKKSLRLSLSPSIMRFLMLYPGPASSSLKIFPCAGECPEPHHGAGQVCEHILKPGIVPDQLPVERLIDENLYGYSEREPGVYEICAPFPPAPDAIEGKRERGSRLIVLPATMKTSPPRSKCL